MDFNKNLAISHGFSLFSIIFLRFLLTSKIFWTAAEISGPIPSPGMRVTRRTSPELNRTDCPMVDSDEAFLMHFPSMVNPEKLGNLEEKKIGKTGENRRKSGKTQKTRDFSRNFRENILIFFQRKVQENLEKIAGNWGKIKEKNDKNSENMKKN